MATWSKWIVRTSFLITFFLIIVNFGDASVTWRRVAKPTLKSQESVPESTILAPTPRTNTKSPITWKRSTIVRRSTDSVENKESEEEFEELNGASSEKDEELKELENDFEVKPLVPGSRPGFWFDSSRRKKPATLLRPGTRRNSLFPTRTSTSTITSPTTTSVTPAPVIPRTPSFASNSNARNGSNKFFGRNRSTSAPFAFKRRLKTTPTPKISSTTESRDLEDDMEDDILEENFEEKEKESERENLSKESNNNESENESIIPIRPKFNSRRRHYNGTRLSWIRQNSLKSARTTTVPPLLTTTRPTSSLTRDYERFSRKTTKFPRTRSKINSSSIPIRSKQTTIKPGTSGVTATKSAVRNRNTAVSDKKNIISEIENEKETGDSDQETGDSDHETGDFNENNTPLSDNYDESRPTSSEEPKPKLRTTVEPFYITKDYGMIGTAIPEFTKNVVPKEHVSLSDIKQTKNTEEILPVINKDIERIVEAALPEVRIKNKQRRKKVTKIPKISTTVSTKAEDIEKEFDYEKGDTDTTVSPKAENIEKEFDYGKEDFESSIEYNDDLEWKFATTEAPKSSTNINEILPVTRKISRQSTTIRPITLPSLPTIDPNSNAYVVWSVGHGGSGWSYQKHGGNVKWSAQNSEADGDSWSVVGKDEDSGENPSYQWAPVRNGAPNYQKNERNKSKTPYSTRKNSDIPPSNTPVTYIPKIELTNKSPANFMKFTDSSSFPSNFQGGNASFSQISTPSVYSSVPATNFTYIQESPVQPTLEEKFNGEVEGIINQYPIVPEYPYIAEFREKYNKPSVPTNTSTTNSFELQEYLAKNEDDNKENEFTTLLPPTYPEYQTNPYPTILPQYETESPYLQFSGDEEISSVKQLPTVNIPPQSYHSRIPPELAKAVVKAKKWKVAGSGGDEGWSLLNEDGRLEWKIHNVDGHWRVSSADQLLKSQEPVQEQNTYSADNQESQSGTYGPNYFIKEDPPKVWTLEDDYEKWRAVSTEGGIPTDESLQETSTSSQEEYDYDSNDYSDDYSSEEDDYYRSTPIDEDAETYSPIQDYGSRPVWGNGENRVINSHSRESFSPFSGNIEIGNTREDAIDAWKSLIAQQGHWKFSDDAQEKLNTYSQQNSRYIQERKDSTIPIRPETELRNQNKNNRVTEERFERPSISIAPGRYHKSGRDHEKEQLPKIGRENEHRHQKQVQEIVKDNNEYVERRQTDKYDKLKETQLPTLNVQLFATKYESIPESTKQYHGKIRSEKDQLEAVPPPRHENEHRLKNNNIKERDQDFSEKKIHQLRDYGNQHFHADKQDYENLNHKSSQKNDDQISEGNVHIKVKDHSKLESLINKLEAIQKESKGRAVIDLTALLNQMKARRNTTSLPNTNINMETNSKHQDGRISNSDTAGSIENRRDSNIIVSPPRTETRLTEKVQDLNKNMYHGSEISNSTHNRMSPENDHIKNVEYKQTNVKSRNSHTRHSKQSKRQKNSAGRLYRTQRPQRPHNNQTSSRRNERTYPAARTTDFPYHKRYRTTENPLKISRGIQRYDDLGRKHTIPFNEEKSARTDSSSSEEIVVDLRDDKKNKSTVSGRQRRPSRKRSRRPQRPKPIVMKGETEVEDEDNGSVKNRKIIVIDYAGQQKKKNPMDKKDLELIIRNVKHRRSELLEDSQQKDS